MRGHARFLALAAMAWAAAAAGQRSLRGENIGWRGDGTGRYPSADPPTTWGRVSKAVKGLRYQAARPAEGAMGRPMPDGVAREWLVLGPVAVPEDFAAKQDALPGEADLDPDVGLKTAQWTWNKAAFDTAYINLAALLPKRPAAGQPGAPASKPGAAPKPGPAVAYACTHVYAEAAGAFRLNLTCVASVRVYVNGKGAHPFGTRFKLDLQRGWNRILIRAAPGEEDWYVVPVLHAWGPAEYDETNIVWKTPLPGVAPSFYNGGMGVGSPVIVGERLYLLSEPQDLICLRKSDGKVLWLRRSSYFEAADERDRAGEAYKEAAAIAARIDALNAAFVSGTARPAQLQEKLKLDDDLAKQMRQVDADKYRRSAIPDVGFSGFTPSTDGRRIYVWSPSGVTACYDLDGRRQWIRLDRRPAVEHGFTSSPLLVDGKLVVFLRDLLAFEADTGRLAWQASLVSHEGLNPEGFFHSSLVAVNIGGQAAIALGNGMILRARDGKVLYGNPKIGRQAVASPVVAGRTLLQAPSSKSQLLIQEIPESPTEPLNLPTRSVAIDLSAFPKHYLPWHLSSPVVHEGLAYLLNNAGVLTVVDLAAGAVVYQKLLDLDPYQAHNEGAARGIGVSLALARRYLYLFGNNGAALVLEPGREYRQVAKNKIESIVMADHWSERQERFVANPVFDGKRLYIRGEGHLYAVEARGKSDE